MTKEEAIRELGIVRSYLIGKTTTIGNNHYDTIVALTMAIKALEHKCHNCKHYLQGEYDGSCGSYICKDYSAGRELLESEG